MVVMYPVLWLLNDLGLSRTTYFLVLLAATTLGATALAYAIHRFVEEPFARMGRTPDRSGKAKSALASG
jgi:peptidoglycan/LPS O-acetylase OafA/YrhL